ncbi:MAG: NmrA/HSCARG family protein [Candidatus Zixiibacteriota bacterium]
MIAKETILVTGATGAQGGSVARFLLESGRFAVRAMTRNPESDKAKALARAGAEVIQGDLGDKDSIVRALKGCDGVFGVTNFWEHFDREREHGQNLIDAVADSGVKHFVFSSLHDANALSNNTLAVPHFQIKADLAKIARAKNLPLTVVMPAFYYENYLYFAPPQKQDDGSFVFGYPQGDTPLAMVPIEDMGGVVAAIFAHRERYLGKTVGIVGDQLTGDQQAELMTRILGKTIRYQHIPRDVFASFDMPGADDLANMFELNRLYITDRTADLNESRALYPMIQTFEQWLIANKSRFDTILK